MDIVGPIGLGIALGVTLYLVVDAVGSVYGFLWDLARSV